MLKTVFASLVTIAGLNGAAAEQGGWTYYRCDVEQRDRYSNADSEYTSSYSIVVKHNALEVFNYSHTWGGGWSNWCNTERDSCYISQEYVFRQREAPSSPSIQFRVDDRLLNRVTGEYTERVAYGELDSQGEQEITVINRIGQCIQLDGSPFEFD